MLEKKQYSAINNEYKHIYKPIHIQKIDIYIYIYILFIENYHIIMELSGDVETCSLQAGYKSLI